MDKAPTFVGIDVAKHRLDVHLRPSGESYAIDYGEEEVVAPASPSGLWFLVQAGSVNRSASTKVCPLGARASAGLS